MNNRSAAVTSPAHFTKSVLPFLLVLAQGPAAPPHLPLPAPGLWCVRLLSFLLVPSLRAETASGQGGRHLCCIGLHSSESVSRQRPPRASGLSSLWRLRCRFLSLANFPGGSVTDPAGLIPAPALKSCGYGLSFDISPSGPGHCHYSCHTVAFREM